MSVDEIVSTVKEIQKRYKRRPKRQLDLFLRKQKLLRVFEYQKALRGLERATNQKDKERYIQLVTTNDREWQTLDRYCKRVALTANAIKPRTTNPPQIYYYSLTWINAEKTTRALAGPFISTKLSVPSRKRTGKRMQCYWYFDKDRNYLRTEYKKKR